MATDSTSSLAVFLRPRLNQAVRRWVMGRAEGVERERWWRARMEEVAVEGVEAAAGWGG